MGRWIERILGIAPAFLALLAVIAGTRDAVSGAVADAQPAITASLTHSTYPNCEYHSLPGNSFTEHLIVTNTGTGTLSGTITVDPPASWLSLPDSGLYSISPGAPSYNPAFTLSTAGLTEGLYQTTIAITHNDPSQPNPLVLPVDLFVFAQFQCGQEATLHTKWLWLQVSSTTRLADRNRSLGLYRSPLSGSTEAGNSTLYDASLLIARSPSPDTVVYRDIYGLGKGQPGYRALTPLTLETSAYGTNTGRVRAYADLMTLDSTLGVHVEYRFPQNADSGEFVLVDYRIANKTQANIPELTVGAAADLDVLPASGFPGSPQNAENVAGLDPNYNLVFQRDFDSAYNPLAAKYLGGISAIQSEQSPRVWDAPNDPWLTRRNGRGFHEGYLYQELAKNGFEILADSNGVVGPADRHAVLAFEKDATLAPEQERRYCLGLVSSTNGPDSLDLLNSTRKAWRYAFGWDWTVPPYGVRHCSTSTVRYTAIGSHEAGLTNGCSGCVVSKVSGSDLISLIPDANPCTGSIYFAGSPRGGQYSAVLRLQTPACPGQPQYTEERTITFSVWFEECSCPDLYDITQDWWVDVFDVIWVINRAFSGSDPIYDVFCAYEQGDSDANGVVDVFDVIRIIEYVFNDGPWCVDPCDAFWNCLPK